MSIVLFCGCIMMNMVVIVVFGVGRLSCIDMLVVMNVVSSVLNR